MRIVHEVLSPMQSSASGNPYVGGGGMGTCGLNDLQIEIMACTDCAANHPDLPTQMFNDDEVIYMEGSAKYIKEMLKRWLSAIESLEKVYLEQLGPARKTNCPNCKPGDEDNDKNCLHLVTCPMHNNYEYFKKKREQAQLKDSYTENGGSDVAVHEEG